MSMVAPSDITCTTLQMTNDTSNGRDKSISGSPRSREEKNNDNGADSLEEETQAAWANEELESSVADEDAWSSCGNGLLTPGHQTSQGVHLNSKGDAEGVHTNNVRDTHSPKKENGFGSDSSSPDNKLRSNSKLDKITPTKKLKYLSQCATQSDEPRILSNTSLISRNKTFYHEGQTPSLRHWEGSVGSLSRYNTSLSFQNDGKHSQKVQNGSKHWEGNKSFDGHAQGTMHRQKTIILSSSNAHANNEKHCDFLVTSCPMPGFSRSKTVGFGPSKGFQAKDTKRDPSNPQLSSSTMIRRITSMSDTDLSKRPSRGNMQTENEAPKNLDQAAPKMEYKVPKAMLPKTGLIKITSLQEEKKNPALYDDYLKKNQGQTKHHATVNKMKLTGHPTTNHIKFVGRRVKPAPLSHQKLMKKQKEMLKHQQQEKEQQELRAEMSQDVQPFTLGDLQRGMLNFDILPPNRRKASQEHELDQTLLANSEEFGDKKTQLPPLELNSPRDNILPPIRT
ncbi:uncharacterized protein LOC135494592 [Lineus longissimus]|uniref:uncharacterized protein LOC135494592 n=1 Tax=Lineus longissimus TaxID=88925 RepID=UPI002B4FB23E